MALHKYLPCRFLALKCSYPPQNTSLPSARENSSPWFISCSISCGGECVTRSKRSGNSFPNLPHSMEKLHIAICEYLCVYTCMDVSKVRLTKELLLPQYNVYIDRWFIRTETSSTNVLDISWGKWLNQAQSQEVPENHIPSLTDLPLRRTVRKCTSKQIFNKGKTKQQYI